MRQKWRFWSLLVAVAGLSAVVTLSLLAVEDQSSLADVQVQAKRLQRLQTFCASQNEERITLRRARIAEKVGVNEMLPHAGPVPACVRVCVLVYLSSKMLGAIPIHTGCSLNEALLPYVFIAGFTATDHIPQRLGLLSRAQGC